VFHNVLINTQKDYISYVIDLQSYITIIYTKKNFKNVDKIFFQKDTTERIISIFTPSFNPGLSN
jgi:hypothetical protein